MANDEATWQADLGFGNIGDWKAQLEVYFGSYTNNAATSGASDAWRSLAEKGHSQMPIYQSADRANAYAPRKNVPLKDLEMAIMRWNADVRLFV